MTELASGFLQVDSRQLTDLVGVTQYLMGAAFHRGADRDLGPIVHDHAGGHGDVHTRL